MPEPGSEEALRPRWWRLCAAAGIGRAADGLLAELARAYAAPDRHYHTLDHVRACLAELDAHRALAVCPAAVELAVFYHDAVLDTRAADNEARSAALARTRLTGAGLEPRMARRVHDLVLATRHVGRPRSGDQALLVDLDLAVLGRDEAGFDAYEAAVRREHAWLPDAAFWSARAALLQRFLSRQWIYHTAAYRACLEQPARGNLERSIARAAGVVGGLGPG